MAEKRISAVVSQGNLMQERHLNCLSRGHTAYSDRESNNKKNGDIKVT